MSWSGLEYFLGFAVLGLILFFYPPLLERIKKNFRIIYYILVAITFLFGCFSALMIFLVVGMGGGMSSSNSISNWPSIMFFGTPFIWGGVCYVARFIQQKYGITQSSSYFIPATLLYGFVWFLLTYSVTLITNH